MGKAFNKLERHIEREYEVPSKRPILKRVKREKHLSTEKEAAKYIANSVAGRVARNKHKVSV